MTFQIKLRSHSGGELKYGGKSLYVAMGNDTVKLTGLRKGTRYRVEFWKTGASNSNIPHIILKTRGDWCQR